MKYKLFIALIISLVGSLQNAKAQEFFIGGNEWNVGAILPPGVQPGQSYWDIQNMITQLNYYYGNNTGPNGNSGYGCDNAGGTIDMCGNCNAVGVSPCNPDPQSTDCAGVPNGTATWSQECECIGGTTGFADCAAKDCDKLIKWVRENKNVDTTSDYFDRNKSIKVANGTCIESTTPTCDIWPRYWNYKNNQKYYYDDGTWRVYTNCNNACYDVVINKSRTITEYPSNGNNMWCVYYTLAALSGNPPCDIAQYYYQYILLVGNQPCTNNVGTFIAHQPQLFGHYGYTLNLNNSISTECDIIKLFMDGKKGVVDNIPGHASMIYGVHRNKQGVVTIDKFDTSGNIWKQEGIPFNNYSPGGTDYEIQ